MNDVLIPDGRRKGKNGYALGQIQVRLESVVAILSKANACLRIEEAIKNPRLFGVRGFFCIGEPDDVLLSHANAHYHRR